MGQRVISKDSPQQNPILTVLFSTVLFSTVLFSTVLFLTVGFLFTVFYLTFAPDALAYDSTHYDSTHYDSTHYDSTVGEQRVEFLNQQKEESDAGHIALGWQLSTGEIEEPVFELQQSPNGERLTFKTVYKGADRASFRSGLPDGTYQFRIRAKTLAATNWGPWSAPKYLHVKHHHPRTVIFFLVTGALVFLATLFLILRGARQEGSIGGNR
jgi:hypothetical protein